MKPSRLGDGDAPMVANPAVVPGRVTALVAAYNCGPVLRSSVQSLLDQTYDDLEIIIVDDGSTDGSVDAIADLTAEDRVRVVHQANSGKAAALNQAVRLATGEHLMIHDGDDQSAPQRVATLVARLQAEPDLVGVLSRHALLVDDRIIAARRRGAGREECAAAVARFQQPAHDPTLLFRRSAVGAPVFDPELVIGQGVDLVLRLGELGPLAVVDEPLYLYRVDPGTNTRRDPERTARFSRLVWEKARARRGDAAADESWAANVPGAVPVGHIVEAVIDARVLDGPAAAVRVVADSTAAFGWRWTWWKPLAFAVAPAPLLRRKRPEFGRRP